MPTQAHDIVVATLVTLLQGSNYDVERGNFPHPSQLGGHKQFRPDLYASEKGKQKYHIYQVWDTEGEGAAVYEIISVALMPNVASYSIVLVENERLASRKNEWTSSYAGGLVDGVLGALDKSRVRLSRNNIRLADVDSTTAKDIEKTKNHLRQVFGF